MKITFFQNDIFIHFKVFIVSGTGSDNSFDGSSLSDFQISNALLVSVVNEQLTPALSVSFFRSTTFCPL